MADPIFGSGIAVDPEDVSDHFGHCALGLGGLDGPRQPGLGNNTGGDVCFQKMNQT